MKPASFLVAPILLLNSMAKGSVLQEVDVASLEVPNRPPQSFVASAREAITFTCPPDSGPFVCKFTPSEESTLVGVCSGQDEDGNDVTKPISGIPFAGAVKCSNALQLFTSGFYKQVAVNSGQTLTCSCLDADRGTAIFTAHSSATRLIFSSCLTMLAPIGIALALAL